MADLTLAGVEKRYGSGGRAVLALSPIDLTVAPHEIVSVVGPSGCGKTTLLRVVAGLTPPTGGEVGIAGRPVWRRGRADPATLEELAMVFQEANLLPWMTIEDNVALPLRLRGVRRRERRTRARELCELAGLGGFERRRPAELSIGMRQRAAIARGLISSPRVLLLDEPFAALDAITREAMNLELQRLWLARPCTIVLVTHSISEAVFLADRVVCMTSRPAKVAGVTDVELPRPRPVECQHTPEFQHLVAGVRSQMGAVA